MSQGNGVAFAFSGAAKKPTRKLDLHGRDDGPKKEALAGVGPDGDLQGTEPVPEPEKPKIIPKQENTYRCGPELPMSHTLDVRDAVRHPILSKLCPHRAYFHPARRTGRATFVPSFIPDAAADAIDVQGIDNFQTAEHDTAVAQKDVAYGLIKRERTTAAAPAAAPSEAETLQRDLQDLPPMASLEAYEQMPVESFGEALLRGMGWSEGRAIGRGHKAEAVATELARRPHRLGLGAAPAPQAESKKKFIKPGETRGPPEATAAAAPAAGAGGSKLAGETARERSEPGVRPGKTMAVVEGRHRGLRCEVMGLEPREEGRSARARVRLLPSHEVVVVRCSELDEVEAAAAARKRERERGGERDDNKRRREASDRDRDPQKDSDQRRDKHEDREEEMRERPWLVPNIRVKIIDKRLQGGRLYLKKGVIVDVKAPTVCDVYVDGTRESVLELRQRQLETVVPSAEGTAVAVLAGPHAGRRGRLLQRNTATGLVAVQFAADLSVHRLSLDDVAEWCGPAGEDDGIF
jgi:G patch domain/KOW motif-containing protein